MEGDDDRISQLPDAVHHQILSLLPIKSVARAGVLSKDWNNALKSLRLDLSDLDFGEEFSSGKTPEEFVGSINLCLRLHGGNSVRRLRLFLYPSVSYNYDVVKWIQFAVDKGVEEVELDFGHEHGPLSSGGEYVEEEKKRFKLPACLSGCHSLTRIKLSRFDFSLPSDFTGFSSLTELCLKEVNMTDEMLEKIIVMCPSLEILSLREISPLYYIKISSPNLRLKFLTVVDCFSAAYIEIDTPQLRSFHFNGDLSDYSFKNVSSLTDAIVCALANVYYVLDYNRTQILAKISHVQILTICTMALLDIVRTEEEAPEDLPISFHNLLELQILFEGLQDDNLTGLYCFFHNCSLPILERLFIELDPFDFNYSMVEATLKQGSPPEHMFCNLRMVKICSFHGLRNEVLLVKFLLARAVALEYMVLVFSEQTIGQSLDLSFVHKLLMRFPKVSSKVQIILYEHAEDDKFPRPMHTKSQYAPYYVENIIGAFKLGLG